MECHRGTTVVPTSEGLPEELIFPHTDQKCLVAPEILLYHIDGSGEDDTDVLHIFLLEGNDLAFAENGCVIGDAVQHGAAVLLGNAFKERSV